MTIILNLLQDTDTLTTEDTDTVTEEAEAAVRSCRESSFTFWRTHSAPSESLVSPE